MRLRGFEIAKGWEDKGINLPKRSTKNSAGYDNEAAEDALTIARVKSFYFKPMTRDEAVLQMNLLDQNFFAFRDEDNGGSFAVVYRRNDGGYGLIDDEA